MLTRNGHAQRNGNEDRCTEDLFDNPDTQNLNKWIPRFVTEVRNKKGEPYPPRSIHLLLAGLQRYMLDKNPGSPKFLNRSESAFCDILTIDCCMEYNYCIECLFYYNFCDWEFYIFPSQLIYFPPNCSG